MSTFTLLVNGQIYPIEADGQMPLLWVLRDLLNLTGTKFSCGEGLCGACNVLVDGSAVRSCITPVSSVAGKAIITIEGLSADGTHPLQRAWQDERVTQCGYSQPGQIMSAVASRPVAPNNPFLFPVAPLTSITGFYVGGLFSRK